MWLDKWERVGNQGGTLGQHNTTYKAIFKGGEILRCRGIRVKKIVREKMDRVAPMVANPPQWMP